MTPFSEVTPTRLPVRDLSAVNDYILRFKEFDTWLILLLPIRQPFLEKLDRQIYRSFKQTPFLA